MDFLLLAVGLHWLLRKPSVWVGCGLGLLVEVLPAARSLCASQCRCDGKLLYCESQSLTQMPRNLSALMGLSLRYNSLSELHGAQFSGLVQLTWLYLDHNHIYSVEGSAFRGLRRLKELVLSSNKITHLPNTTFRPMPNLRHVQLSYNNLQALEPDLFHGLRKLQTLHLRSNALQSIPVRIFQDCRSMEFLDVGYNQLKSLARNAFAGLLKLTELHLEHNDLVKVNFAHFPRLLSLQTLHMQWNKVQIVVNSLEWTWNHLERLDLSGNEIEYVEPHAFRAVPNLKMLQLDSNRLSSIDQTILDSWSSLTSISLSGNSWECSRNICALATWLSSFQGQHESSLLCASPEHTQGEDVLDAVHGFHICDDLDTSTPATAGTTAATATAAQRSVTAAGEALSSAAYNTGDTTGVEPTAPVTVTVTSEEGSPEPRENTIQVHKVITGTMALLFSFLIVVLVLYVSWKCFPAGLRHLRQCFVTQRRKQKQQQTMHQMAAMSTQEYYVDYKPNHIEGALVIINDYGSCSCHQQPSRECEV
ncbi:leucine-rich repeat transmembrane neuronal protein 1 [Callorhinchus milii]|uniref:leucine-rich repeat transmembrane neuronal protein 1 n=1 Tax=Callorhinchus milii TaxID=7868 RepID=UPI0004574D00|nr:leucine-rich repeat transmembrane neuronal protein 1 [Callorhinchus milii]|eukprot:gi/632985025/ref/XP_007909450.1/ PREDICTED: leucine-rich repeat transmembrane neuronal protein 1 [Callorhinchus milii]